MTDLHIHHTRLTPQMRGVLEGLEVDAEAIARRALDIAADLCIYTNKNIIVESL